MPGRVDKRKGGSKEPMTFLPEPIARIWLDPACADHRRQDECLAPRRQLETLSLRHNQPPRSHVWWHGSYAKQKRSLTQTRETRSIMSAPVCIRWQTAALLSRTREFFLQGHPARMLFVTGSPLCLQLVTRASRSTLRACLRDSVEVGQQFWNLAWVAELQSKVRLQPGNDGANLRAVAFLIENNPRPTEPSNFTLVQLFFLRPYPTAVASTCDRSW
jgi:hypothetical protein